MLLTLVGVAAAYVTLQGGSDAPLSDEPLDGTPPPEDIGVKEIVPSSSPQWKPYLEAARGDLPLDFLERWILRESGGNPCSVGSVTQLRSAGWAREAGIGQLYFESRDQRVFGVTLSDLRSACSATDQSQLRELTEEECQAQVKSLVAMASSYLAIGDSQLAAQGLLWSDAERLAFAKLHHALPALATFLPHAVAADSGSSWADFRAYTCALEPVAVTAINRGTTPYMPFDRLFDNAAYTGGLA